MEARYIADDENSNKQHTDSLGSLRTWARTTVLRELLTNSLSAKLSLEDISAFHLQAESYQVVICEDFNCIRSMSAYSFAELLKVTNKDNSIFEPIQTDNRDIVVLKGALGSKKLSEFVDHFEKQPPQEGSPLGSIFLAYGRPVISLEELHLSYEDALALLNRRFFCARDQHVLGYHVLHQSPATPPHKLRAFSDGILTDYVALLTGYIQSYNRNMIAETLSELAKKFQDISDDTAAIRLFLADLYFQIKEHVIHNYSHIEIPFEKNAVVIEYIGGCNCLYAITDFLFEKFEMIMNAIGNPSRDTILDDVLFYIDHNFTHNIKLESIASLFGYNSAYLGKIFHRTVGESFNSYIDHKRIEYSKKLLLENRLRVYEIAEQSGYKNVDYFHKKFKKYVGESPIEYRKRMEP